MKVKSSEEQEEAKRKEKAEKVRLYREVTNKIYEKVLIWCFVSQASRFKC